MWWQMYNLVLVMILPREIIVAVPDDQAQFNAMEEQVYRRVAKYFRGALPVYLPTIDEDTGADDEAPAQHRKKHKGTSSKLRTADTTVVNQVAWPHKPIYTPSGQPAMYEELSSMASVNGYLAVTALESEQIKGRMLSHLQEIMEDGEAYVWSIVRSYHVNWLQHLEQVHAP